jgi:hypothetical protein
MFTKKKQPIQHNYILHNHLLESVSSAKYLGITVQSNLKIKWDKHINDITSKGNKALGFLKRNQKTSNQQIKTQAYQALVRPKLEYSCSIWDPHTSESIEKLRWSNDELLGTSVIDTTIPSVSDMLNIINLPSLAERRLRTRLVMMYKVSFHLVAVPSDILIVSDTRTRK